MHKLLVNVDRRKLSSQIGQVVKTILHIFHSVSYTVI